MVTETPSDLRRGGQGADPRWLAQHEFPLEFHASDLERSSISSGKGPPSHVQRSFSPSREPLYPVQGYVFSWKSPLYAVRRSVSSSHAPQYLGKGVPFIMQKSAIPGTGLRFTIAKGPVPGTAARAMVNATPILGDPRRFSVPRFRATIRGLQLTRRCAAPLGGIPNFFTFPLHYPC